MSDYWLGECWCPTATGHHVPAQVYGIASRARVPWTFCRECRWALWGLYLITEEPW